MASEPSTPRSFTPALGKDWLTPAYDLAIALLTREQAWRGLLTRQIGPSPGDRILDVGCGTGTLAVMLARSVPGATVIGLDPDSAVLAGARAKAAAAGVSLSFVEGFMSEEALSRLRCACAVCAVRTLRGQGLLRAYLAFPPRLLFS